MPAGGLLAGLTVAAVAGVLSGLPDAPALAHSALTGSDPASGSSPAAPPGDVRLSFSRPVSPGFGLVTVAGPDGAHHQAGAPIASGRTVVQRLDRLALPGTYRVSYRFASQEDAHPVAGTVTFHLTPAAVAAAGVAPGPAPASASLEPASTRFPGPGGPLWVGAATVLLTAGVVARRRAGGRDEVRRPGRPGGAARPQA